MSLSEGQVLEGKYVIRRRIADGGMSTVYLGVNQRIGKDVAVKVLNPVVARDRELADRFEREACIVSRIRSANVADVYDFGELPSGERFMVMEYLEGESLATRLVREGTLPPVQLAKIAEQILVALAAAHEAGVVHRDLKPENVLLIERGKDLTVKLVDFGISKVLPRSPWRDLDAASSRRNASATVDARMTAVSSVLGTPLYMSPEQAQGNEAEIDERTDIYALGVILYEATAGEVPFVGDNVNELLLRIVLDEPQPLEARAPWVDPGWSAIVERALAKSPADRYRTADEMREAIAAWSASFRLATSRSTRPGGRAARRDRDDVDPTASPFPALAPISIDGLVASPGAMAARSSIVVELESSAAQPPARRKGVRRWAFAAPLIGVAVFSAIMAHRALFASPSGAAPSVEPAPAPPVRAAPAPVPSPPPARAEVLDGGTLASTGGT